MKKQPGYQQKEREHFDRLAEESSEIWWGSATQAGKQRLARRARRVVELLEAFSDPRVFEVGCGVGAFSMAVLELYPDLKLTGCDISPKSLALAMDRCTEFGAAEFVEMDVTDLSFEDGSFEAVVGNSVLHHLPAEETLAQCFDVLVPGGIIWFSEPNMMNPQIALEKNVRFIGKMLQNTEDETAFFRWPLAGLLEQIGFVDVNVTPFDFLHPAVPPALIGMVDRAGRLFERFPVIREIAGSLDICATRPA